MKRYYMEYKVIASTYTSKKLQKQTSGWIEELKNLSRQLNEYAEEKWIVKVIIPTSMGSGIVYTILLERNIAGQSG